MTTPSVSQTIAYAACVCCGRPNAPLRQVWQGGQGYVSRRWCQNEVECQARQDAEAAAMAAPRGFAIQRSCDGWYFCGGLTGRFTPDPSYATAWTHLAGAEDFAEKLVGEGGIDSPPVVVNL